MIGEGGLVLVGVEEDGEAVILPLDVLPVFGLAVDLEDAVPVVVVVDAALGG